MLRIEYDVRAQAPFFRYTDSSGKQHEVWFEDARSIQAKFNLIKELRNKRNELLETRTFLPTKLAVNYRKL